MFNFDEKAFLEKEKNALAIRADVEKAIDAEHKKGFKNVFFIGVGGSTTAQMEMEPILKSRSTLGVYLENAAEFVTRGNKRFSKDSLVVTSSVSGDTAEIVRAIEYAKSHGAKVIAFVKNADTPVGKLADYPIANEAGNTYFWYAVTMRLMFLNGDFPEYDKFFKELDSLPDALVDVQKKADDKALEFAEKYWNEPILYFVGAGNMWGWAYCYAMCLLEEMQWMRTKSIHASDFFHGTLEVIDRDTAVVLFKGEDETRPLADRVEKFVPRVSARFTAFDTKDYKLKGISPEFRGLISPRVMEAVCERITAHLEHYRKHPKEIRRYYRKLTY
ncbi:MAG: SIS domain-containing protein [Synergistaceae bacterium]|jgi:fructoselysine-6-phosphate deglycase|nr:SIS domain-containing protein [Synergistaceae bacterium]